MKDFKEKASRLIKAIAPFTGYITSDTADIEYFTGLSLEASERNFILVQRGKLVIFVSPLSAAHVKAALPGAKIIVNKTKTGADAADYIKKQALKGLVFDKNKELYSAGETLLKAKVTPAAGVTLEVRKTKTPAEIALMRKAAQIAYKAYVRVKPLIKTGMTELDVAALLENCMKSLGASRTSFNTIVAFGKNAANPHHATGSTKLKAEDAVLMDFGCVYKGYCSDITRSWWHGNKPAQEYTKIWNIVDTAKKLAVKQVKDGTTAKAADKICRDIIVNSGYGPFIHSTGHGVGMNIHEAPLLGPLNETDVLVIGNVFSIEPGIYIHGKFGVRLEDTVTLDKKGVVILTKN